MSTEDDAFGSWLFVAAAVFLFLVVSAGRCDVTFEAHQSPGETVTDLPPLGD
jgi:hypothetical protein